MGAYVAASRSAATRRAYQSAWERFAAWCGVQGVPSLPTPPEALAAYVAGLADGTVPQADGTPGSPLSAASIDVALSAISQAHAAAGHPSPRDSELVRRTRAGVRRVKGTAQKQAEPLLLTDLHAIIAALPHDAQGLRDRALLLLGHAGALRESELVNLDVSDIAVEKPRGIVLTLRRSKTDQEGRGRRVAIRRRAIACPVRALQAWFDAAGIVEGRVFPISERHVDRIVQRSVALIGLDPSRYSGHSLRRGLVTDAHRRGHNDRDIMAITGHRDHRTFSRYVEVETALNNPATVID